MPADEQNTDSAVNPYAWATPQNVIAAASSIAVAYGAYKVIGGLFNSNSTPTLFNPVHLNQWRNLVPERELIHVVQTRYLNSSPLFHGRAQDVFKTWDIISASLVDARLITTGAGAERYTGLGGAVGLMLQAAPQNILGTHPHDVSFPNHAKGWNLVDDFLAGRSKNHENPLKHPHYNRLMTPDELLRQRPHGMYSTAFGTPDYNEVLIAAKANVRTYEGYPATDYLTVKGVVLIPGAGTGVATDREMTAAKQLKEVNPELPVYGVASRKFVVRIS